MFIKKMFYQVKDIANMLIENVIISVNEFFQLMLVSIIQGGPKVGEQ